MRDVNRLNYLFSTDDETNELFVVVDSPQRLRRDDLIKEVVFVGRPAECS